jgi:signal transduction histidine kinase
MEDIEVLTSFSLKRIVALIPYLLTLGATSILFIYNLISYLNSKDKLLKDFIIYLGVQTIYLCYAIFLFLFFEDAYKEDNLYSILKESLEILNYFFYLKYTTNAIDFDKTEYRKLNFLIKFTMAIMLLYLPLQLIVVRYLELSNNFIFIGIRLIMFLLTVIMIVQSYKIKGNKILNYVRVGTILFFLFGLMSFTFMLNIPQNTYVLPYHFILLATLIDIIIFSVAMSKRVKHQIVSAEKLASDKEVEIQTLQYRKEIEIKEQKETFQKKLAMDLHDDIGSSLSSILINSELAIRTLHNQPQVASKILDNINFQSSEISTKLSDFIWSLQIDNLKNSNNIKQRLLDYQQDLFEEMKINFNYDIEEIIFKENSNEKIGLMRNILMISKEAMNNIAKYSNAKNVTISLKKQNENLKLIIQDDGIGFDTNNIRKGNGLGNIKLRSESMNGECNIQSSLKKGTRIEINIPYQND